MTANVYCRSTVNYVGAEGYVPAEVDILDARSADNLKFDDCGFELITHESEVTDWLDPSQMERHYDEIILLCKRLVGCDWVLFYPGLVRSPEAELRHEDMHPIQVVHSDYTEAYWQMIGNEDHPYHATIKPSMERAGVTGSDIRSARRVLTLQFWRNIGEPVVDFPLCFGDARSFDREELTPIVVEEYGGVAAGFESFLVLAPQDKKKHRWYTFPAMTHSEAVMFRAFDSDMIASGGHFWTPHTAFADTSAPADAPRRRSVEMRAICGFSA